MKLPASSPPLVIQVSLPIESFFYGVFLLLFCLSTILFWYRHQYQRRFQIGNSFAARPVLILSLLLFTTVTGHWVVSWINYFTPYIDRLQNSQTGDPVSFELLKSMFVVVSVLLADTAFIYRLWTVWGNESRIIIFPCVTLIGLLVTGTNIIVGHVTLDLNSPSSNKVFNSWVLADISFTICTNVYCSAFISWKIWQVSKGAQDTSRGSKLLRVLSTIVESATFYTFWMATALGLNLAKSPVGTIFIDANPAAAAIAFMLINVRVGLGWAATQSPAWRSTVYDTQFKTADGELRFVLNHESTDVSLLRSVPSVGNTSVTNSSGKP